MNNSILIYFILIFLFLIKKKKSKNSEKFSQSVNNSIIIFPLSNFETVKTNYKFTFYLSSTIPKNGKIKIIFPTGYNLDDIELGMITGTASSGTFDKTVTSEQVIIERKNDGDDWNKISNCQEVCNDPKVNKPDASEFGTIDSTTGNKICTLAADKKLKQDECNDTIQTKFNEKSLVTINLKNVKNPTKGFTGIFKIETLNNDDTNIETLTTSGIDIVEISCPSGTQYSTVFCKTYNFQCHRTDANGNDICTNKNGKTTSEVAYENNLKNSFPEIGKLKMASMPFGTILPFMGADSHIPYGWKVCDGNNNTPDLRGLFLFSHDSSGNNHLDYKRKIDVDSSGNYIHNFDEIKLSEDNIPEHKHTGKIEISDDEVHNYNISILTSLQGLVGAGPYDYYHNYYGNMDSERSGTTYLSGQTSKDKSKHKHDLSTTSTEDTNKGQASGDKFELMPPFYVVRYIIKLI